MRVKGQMVRNVLIVLAADAASNRNFVMGVAHESRLHANWRVTFVDSRVLTVGILADRLGGITIDAIIAKEDVVPKLVAYFGEKLPPMAIFGSARHEVPVADAAYFSAGGSRIGNDAAQYLAGLGNFASYAFIGEETNQTFVTLRRKGFVEELAHRGITASVSLDSERPRELRAFLKSLPYPAAVFCACDLYAVHVLEACCDLGLSVPRQVSVLGVDNDDTIGMFANPPLSSLKLPYEELGACSVRALEKRFRLGRFLPGHSCEIFRTQVIERDSTATPVPATHLIKSALEFIRAEFASKLTVGIVAGHLGISRKLLERRFREMGQGTVLEAIQEVRFDALTKMLLASDKPIVTLGRTCGFTNPTWLKTLFRKRYGLTMSEYRARAGRMR